MWLSAALVGCLLWAVIFVLDAHLVGRVYARPWVALVVSAAFSVAVLPFAAAWAAPGWPPLGAGTALLALAAGAAFVVSQLAHFHALRHTEAGIVAAYWGLGPVFVLAGSFLLLGERLSIWEYAGVAVLVAASVVFCLLDTHRQGRWQALGAVAAGCLFQAGYFVLQKLVFEATSIRQGFFLILVGITASGLAPLLLPGVRRVVRGNVPALRSVLGLLAGIELASVLAVLAGQVAVDLGTPSLVAAVEAAVPGVTFLLSVGLFALFGRFGEAEARRRLPAKLALVGVMGVGLWMLS